MTTITLDKEKLVKAIVRSLAEFGQAIFGQSAPISKVDLEEGYQKMMTDPEASVELFIEQMAQEFDETK